MPDLKRSPPTKPAHARTNFDDRISAAAAAKQALLERFRSRPAVGDPAWVEQQAALKAVADAREARAAERRAAKDAETARLRAAEEAEAARVAAEQAARRTEEQIAAAEAKAKAAALEAERKAARDARYAARKARKR